ncbi:MAG: EAL domain-containing protein [Anaeroplasmataceae bacterium]
MNTKQGLCNFSYFKKLFETTKEEFVIDSLTKLVSRKYILGFIESLIQEKTPFSMIFLDLDNFKDINDDFGHLIGDRILLELGKLLKLYCKNDAVIGRYGGDEFIIVYLKDNSYNGVYDFLFNMYGNNSVLSRRIDIDDKSIYVTGTIGSASYPTDALDYKELFLKADKALYRGKSKGRNCFIIYLDSKHKNIDINKIVRKPLHEVLTTVSNIFLGINTIDNKIHNSIKYLCDELKITDALFISFNGYEYSNNKTNISAIKNVNFDNILEDGLFYCNNIEYVRSKSEALWQFMIDNDILSILITSVPVGKSNIGYLIFVESSIERLWQEDDLATIVCFKQLISTRGESVKYLMGDEFVRESDKVLHDKIFDALVNNSNKRYLFICNLATNNSRWSKNAVDYFNLEGEIIHDFGQKWALKIHPSDRERYLLDIEEVFSGKKGVHKLDYRVMNKYGEYVFCTCHGKMVKKASGDGDIFVGTLENHGIADYIDPVTNLYNIYKFNEIIDDNVSSNMTLLLVGLIRFGDINTLYGYHTGDEVLKEIAKYLLGFKDHDTILFKMDGVRFGILLKNKPYEAVEKLYTEIKEKLLNGIYAMGFKIAVNVGGAVVEDCDIYDKRDVISGASLALIRSKYENNGDLIKFNDELFGVNEKNIRLMVEIRESILNNYSGFDVAYQPVIDSKTEQLAGAEALVRWNSPSMGFISPATFIPWLETDQCFFDLGKWILKHALEDMLPMLDIYPDFVLNVNISYTQIQKQFFVETILDILKLTKYPAKNLCLELTERCRHLDEAFLKNVVDKLRSYGIKIAIDDFGTGFSSLDLLIKLPADTIKIDRSFITDLDKNPINQCVVEAVINCANKLNLDVCFEGVETKNVLDILKTYNPSSFQGYYYSKPLYLFEFKDKYCK